jgi:hypothetical protein
MIVKKIRPFPGGVGKMVLLRTLCEHAKTSKKYGCCFTWMVVMMPKKKRRTDGKECAFLPRIEKGASEGAGEEHIALH